ncbi:MAG: FGGY-family carbohydrate kinase [Acetobacteraceae bacterium]
MTGRDLAIGLDVGTSGVRAIAIDGAGRIAGEGRADIGVALRRDAAAIWAAVELALGALCARVEPARIAAIAVDGTSGTIIATGASGEPVAPASLYNDKADAEALARVRAVAPAESAVHGGTSPLARMLAIYRIPGVRHVLHEADWVAFRLGGPLGVSDANNALKSGYDPIANAWPGWIGDVGLSLGLLPRVEEPGQAVGTVCRRVAERFGISRHALIVAGTTDGCASFLATGARETGEAVSALGSTLTVKVLSEVPVFSSRYGIYSHRLLGRFLPGGASNAGAGVLAQFFAPARIAELSARIDPAKDTGLDYYPLPGIGERFPLNDPALAPRLTPRPTDDALYLHGLLEGLARIEALAYRRLTELGAPRIVRVLSVGGGAVNEVWVALRARILGVPVARAAETEAAYGVARLAALGSPV